VENCSEFILPTKNFFMLMKYFFSHLQPQNLNEILIFLANLSKKQYFFLFLTQKI